MTTPRLNDLDDNLQFEVTIEVPRWGFVKRGRTERVDFISPLPCPFNYGAIADYLGGEGDLLDAVVLGPRLARGTRVTVQALGAVGLTDRGLYDDKLICSTTTLSSTQQRAVIAFFHFYAGCKRLLNVYRGRPGRTACEGWDSAANAFGRAKPAPGGWREPAVRF
jgi:inorganic pyrophosphatase